MLALGLGACGDGGSDTLTVYSGRTENLIGPLLDDFTEATGIDVEVRFGQSADLALLIDQEGDRSPADVFISQSPGAVGFLAEADLLRPIGDDALELVDPAFRSASGRWVAMSGRVRVVVYNRDLVDPGDLPTSVFGLTDERYRGQVAVAPANGSFQDFVTAMREIHGDDATAEWLEGMADNDARTYPKNSAIVQAVGRGDVPMGLVNHYYNYRELAENPGAPSVNYFFPDGDVGSLLIATALGVLESTDDADLADDFVEFMLGEQAQRFFSEETLEYPIAASVAPAADLPPLSSIEVATYDFDRLGGGLERTRELINDSGFEG